MRSAFALLFTASVFCACSRNASESVKPTSTSTSTSTSSPSPMAAGLSPGTAWIAIAEGKAADAGPTVTPEVVKLVPDAVRRVREAKENVALHDIDVEVHEKTIELVFLPRLAPGEQLHPGGGTSLGREVHVHYDRATGAFVRLHWAR